MKFFPFSSHLILRFILGTALVASSGSIQAVEEQPNILFILADDVSYRNISCYPGSYDFAKTPAIDQIASEGMLFTRGYAGTWCMASRTTLMTGHQQYGNRSMKLKLLDYPAATYDADKMPMWPTALRANGYHTAMIGKWHIGKDAGFGRVWDHQRVWNRCKHTDNAHAYYEAELIETDGGDAVLVDGYPTDFYTDWAIDYVDGKTRDPNKPWFLWLCYGSAHGPFIPNGRDLDTFPGVSVDPPADIFPPRPGKPRYMQKVDTWKPGPMGRPILEEFHTPKGSTVCLYGPDISDWNRQYQQAIKALDDNVARLMKALDASGQRENTLVVFTADQGFAFGQHGFATKMAPYDANIRPPLIFSQPGTIPSGSTCAEPVAGPDIVSTLVAQSKTADPWFMHGHDFSVLLKDPESAEWNHGALLALTGIEWGKDTNHFPRLIKHVQGIPWWVSYSKGKYKYIRTFEKNEIEEFYDMEADPGELTNLALDPAFHDMIRDFRDVTLAELVRTQAPYVEHLPSMFPLTDRIVENYKEAGDPDRAEQEAEIDEERRKLKLPFLAPFHPLFDLY